MKPIRTPFSNRAFSLIEIMVAVSLLAVIIVGLLAMFYQVQRAFRVGTAQSDIMEGGRATMSLLVRDLQDMAACNLELVTNVVIAPSFRPPPINPTSFQNLVSGGSRQNFLQDLSFLTRVNDKWIGTAYCLSNATSGVGTLYRMMDARDNETLPLVNSNLLHDLSTNFWRSSPYDNTNYHRVVDGVVHFTITPCDKDGHPFAANNLDSLPAATDADGNTNANLHVFYTPDFIYHPVFAAFRSNALPAYLDIELAVLEPSALAKFRVREEIGQTQAAEFLARQIGATHVFRQRVAIRPAATDIGVRY